MLRTALARTLTPLALVALLIPAVAGAAGDADAGKGTYTTLCVSCHGTTGKGDGPAGAALNPKPRDFSIGDYKYDADGDGTPGTDADMALIIKYGAAKYGGSALMAPWGHLSDKQIQDVVAYVRTLKQ